MPRGKKKKRRILSEIIDTAKLIGLVEGKEILYDYKYSKLRSLEKVAAWQHIADELGCEVKLVRLKWSYLRDQYIKYLRREVQYKKAKKNYTVWKYAPALEFVKPFIVKTFIDGVTDDEASYETRNDVPSTSKSTTKKVPPPKIDEDNLSDDEEIIDKDLDAKPNTEEDDFIDDDFDEDELDESLDSDDKQPISTSSIQNQNANSSTICSTKSLQLESDDFIFLGYSRTIKKFPPIQQSLVKFRIAELVMKMETASNDDSVAKL